MELLPPTGAMLSHSSSARSLRVRTAESRSTDLDFLLLKHFFFFPVQNGDAKEGC